MDTVRRQFIKEFKLPQSEQQGLAELWDIKQQEDKTAWECMQ